MPSTAAVRQKRLGAFYTPHDVARILVSWVVRDSSDRLLDPSCGDGRFLCHHSSVAGVDFDPSAIARAAERAPHARLFATDFFTWAGATRERFECIAGNPPFIRYQHFSGKVRDTALRLSLNQGVRFSELTSSWAPFLAVATSLLKPGGRMAFVVPAEIGHSTYAKPLLKHLMRRFAKVLLVAVRDKIFPELSEDVWLLYVEGFGSQTDSLEFHSVDELQDWKRVPKSRLRIARDELDSSDFRLRRFLIPVASRALYESIANEAGADRLGDLARVGIGYVTGANDFFHLRPSEVSRLRIPEECVVPAVRSGRVLRDASVNQATVDAWIRKDEPVLLLRLDRSEALPAAVRKYLESSDGRTASKSYKCRVRDPWYVIPSVTVPDGFLSYMSGEGPSLVENEARCVGTNSVHLVCLRDGIRFESLAARWPNPLTRLSCELEGHPLGGGMLKLEPREASRILLPPKSKRFSAVEIGLLDEGLCTLRQWRHYV